MNKIMSSAINRSVCSSVVVILVTFVEIILTSFI